LERRRDFDQGLKLDDPRLKKIGGRSRSVVNLRPPITIFIATSARNVLLHVGPEKKNAAVTCQREPSDHGVTRQAVRLLLLLPALK
jgi:hypothetical protein